MRPSVFRGLVAAALGAAGAFVSLALVAGAREAALAKNSKQELQRDLRDENLSGDWIYDDIDAGFQRAARERKPVFLVFR